MEIEGITVAKLLFAQWEMELDAPAPLRYDQLVERYMNLICSYPTLDMLLSHSDIIAELWIIIVDGYSDSVVN